MNLSKLGRLQSFAAYPRCWMDQMAEMAVDRRNMGRVLGMLRAGLLHVADLREWADLTILRGGAPPPWVLDLALAMSAEAASACLARYVYSEPFESSPAAEVDLEYVASLFLRYTDKNIDWSAFLLAAGDYADGADGPWQCEDFFSMLNELEAAEHAPELEARQAACVREKLGQSLATIERLRAELETWGM